MEVLAPRVLTVRYYTIHKLFLCPTNIDKPRAPGCRPPCHIPQIQNVRALPAPRPVQMASGWPITGNWNPCNKQQDARVGNLSGCCFVTFSPSVYYQRNFLPQLRTISMVSLAITSTTKVTSNSNTQMGTAHHNGSSWAWDSAGETMEARGSFGFCRYGGSMWLLGLRRYCRVCVSAASDLDKKLSTKSARDCSKSSLTNKKKEVHWLAPDLWSFHVTLGG